MYNNCRIDRNLKWDNHKNEKKIADSYFSLLTPFTQTYQKYKSPFISFRNLFTY